MQLIKILSFSLLMGVASYNASALNPNKNISIFAETPVKTVCIKNPNAADANTFFSSITVLNFWVYKPGNDLGKIMDALKASPNVESCIEGKPAGDYKTIVLTLKSKKDKAWFAAEFKNAGLAHIKINNNEAVEIDKL